MEGTEGERTQTASEVNLSALFRMNQGRDGSQAHW